MYNNDVKCACCVPVSAMAERLANHFSCYRPASDLFLQLLDMDKVEDAKFMLAVSMSVRVCLKAAGLRAKTFICEIFLRNIFTKAERYVSRFSSFIFLFFVEVWFTVSKLQNDYVCLDGFLLCFVAVHRG